MDLLLKRFTLLHCRNLIIRTGQGEMCSRLSESFTRSSFTPYYKFSMGQVTMKLGKPA